MRAVGERMSPGSYLILSHLTSEGHPPEIVAEKEAVFARSNAPVSYRSRDQILRMFDGFDLVEPGLTAVTQWRGDPLDEKLDGHYRLDAVRGHLYEMLGEHETAATHFTAAARRTTSVPEQNYLTTKAAQVSGVARKRR